jgi:hypothetical protein
MSVFRSAPPERTRLIHKSRRRGPKDLLTAHLAVFRCSGRRQNPACSGAVSATIALLILIIEIGRTPFSIAQSRPIDLSRGEVGAPPQQFAFWRARRADVGHWAVVDDSASDGGTAIQRSDTDRSVQAALAVYTPVSERDARIRTHFRLIGGSTPSAGVVLRIAGPDDYYLVRASVDEQRVSLLHIVRGVSEEIAGVDADVARNQWQTLEVGARGNEFTIWLDDRWVLTAFDDSKLVAGRFGMWTERDDVTRFNQIEISPLASDHGRSDLQGRPRG